MKIPKLVKIGETTCKISREYRPESQDDGLYDPVTKQIWVCPNSTEPEKSFLHEYFHACFDEIGINQTGMHEDVQEILCEKLAQYTLKLMPAVKR